MENWADSNTAVFNIIEQSNSKVISLQVISFLIALEISYWVTKQYIFELLFYNFSRHCTSLPC